MQIFEQLFQIKFVVHRYNFIKRIMQGNYQTKSVYRKFHELYRWTIIIPKTCPTRYVRGLFVSYSESYR